MAGQPGRAIPYGAGGGISRDYSRVTDILLNMFGHTMNKDALSSVVECCDGDLTHSIDAVMTIMNDSQVNNPGPSSAVQGTSTVIQGPPNDASQISEVAQNTPKSISYAAAGASKAKPISKDPKKCVNQTTNKYNYNSNDLQSILSNHAKGLRILVLMRGPPGCGKSHLAKTIVGEVVGSDTANLTSHIFSSDDFFFNGQRYFYDRFKIGEAHTWNQHRVISMLLKGFSPIIVDNTNIEVWEMQPYVMHALREGYIIEVVEPATPWAKNAYQLYRRNTHDVPLQKIKRMIDNFNGNLSGQGLLNMLGLNYPNGKIPTVLRNYPPIKEPPSIMNHIPQNEQVATNNISSTSQCSNENIQIPIAQLSVDSNPQKLENSQPQNISPSDLAKLEHEWEMGEKWEEGCVSKDTAVINGTSEPKPPRPAQKPERFESIASVGECDDWREITKFLPPWEDEALPGSSSKNSQHPKDKTSKYTSIERGDSNTVDNKYIIVSTTPRDINFYYMPLEKEEMPDKRMISRSSWTEDDDPMSDKKCEFEEQHFNTLRKMFRNIPKADLKEIFDFCKGDVHWCFNIILDGVHDQNPKTGEEDDDLSDSDDFFDGQCDCLAAYNVVPDARPSIPKDNPEEQTEATVQPLQAQPKKTKKDKVLPNSLVELKKRIEENVQIGDNHYSQHCLKIKKIRRGETETNATDNVKPEEMDPVPSTSTKVDDDSPDEETDTVNVNIGREFVEQLDEMFGREEMEYPVNIVPIVNMPVATLNEINALWIESLTHQLATQEKYSDILMKQDEEFAKKLMEKEEELALAGEEPKFPDFKEIMDMDLALSLHQRDVASWRNNVPNDLASKMSRDKLYNLFPEIEQEVLCEMLMAHDNNFQSTVEILLTSTGRSSLLEEKNGINKFIVQKQIERQQQLIEQSLNEQEWPVLVRDANLTMADVNNYRQEAQKHLDLRNQYYAKATEYVGLGMTPAATYYSSVAAYHKRQFEHANSKAASSLIQVNSGNRDNKTLDLHYLFVAEALEALDLFLDHHIQSLRGAPSVSARLYLITGRGLHSRAGPRIKPAAIKRLRERELQGSISELNPGLLSVVVRASSKLAEEI